jgi:hypothetical protein
MLASTLPDDSTDNWTKKDKIEYAAWAWLNEHRYFKSDKRHPLYPEAETIVCSDIATVAELVSKYIGPELFGQALDDGLNLEKLLTAARQPRFNIKRFVEGLKAGKRSIRYFGNSKPQPARDVSGYTARDRAEMVACYALDDSRFGHERLHLGDIDDAVGQSEDDALWPSAEVLEAAGVDVVVLEQIRFTLGTDGLASLYAKGVDLARLTTRVRRGANVRLLARAFDSGLPVSLFNSNGFRTSRYQSKVIVLDGRDFASDVALSGLYGNPAGFARSMMQ